MRGVWNHHSTGFLMGHVSDHVSFRGILENDLEWVHFTEMETSTVLFFLL
jgi:hypothetical protein